MRSTDTAITRIRGVRSRASPSRAFRLPGLALLLSAWTSGTAGNQEPADTSDSGKPDSVSYRLAGITVEAARPAVTGGGASAVEVTLDSLASPAPSPTLAETIRRMPLLRVRQNSRSQVQPSLRGMEERQIAVLLDGVPITVGWDNRTDFSVLPATGANRGSPWSGACRRFWPVPTPWAGWCRWT